MLRMWAVGYFRVRILTEGFLACRYHHRVGQ